MRNLQRVEEGERLLLAALQIEREGRTGAGAMAVVDVRLPRSFFQKAEIADAFDLWMLAQEFAYRDRVLAGALHPEFKRLEAPEQHPGGIRVADAAHDVTHHTRLVDYGSLADQRAGYEGAVTARIFGQAVDAEVGALRDRLGPERPEEGIVDRDRRQLVLASEGSGAGRGDCLDVHENVRRVRRAFEIDEGDPALGLRPGHDLVQLLTRRACGEVDILDAELRQDHIYDGLAGGVERARVDH